MLAVVWSPACAACAAPLPEPTRGIVCQRCWDALAGLGGPPGGGGGAGTAARRSAFLIGPRDRGPRTVGRAAGPYEGPLRAILHAFKYDGYRSLARPLAELLRRAGADVLAGADLVVPVPLHWRRRRHRGFNQAAELAAYLGLPMAEALRRTRATPSQVGLSRAERARSVRGAIALARGGCALREGSAVRGSSAVQGSPLARGGSVVRGRSVVLVDDVLTTGATIEACAAVLRAAGAGRVRALTVARAAAPPPVLSPPRPRPRPARRRSAPSSGPRPAAGSSP